MICDVLSELLEYGGITNETPPVLYFWQPDGDIEKRIEIKSFDQFFNTFCEGRYQVYLEYPILEYIDTEKISITSLSITVAYSGSGDWSEPRVQTIDEEITQAYSGDDLGSWAKVRANKIAEKVKAALTILSLFIELYRSTRGTSSS